MTDIELRNEGGVIKGYDRDTGEQVPVSFEDAKFNSVQAEQLNNVRFVNVENHNTGERTIRDALDSLPSDGGMIMLSSGTFEDTNVEIWKNNVAFVGQGKSTVIKIPDDATFTDADAGDAIVDGTGTEDSPLRVMGENCSISNLTLDGNAENNQDLIREEAGGGSDSFADGIGIFASDCIVHSVWVRDVVGHGIIAWSNGYGSELGSKSQDLRRDIIISDNNIKVSGSRACIDIAQLSLSSGDFAGDGNHVTITGNACEGKDDGIGDNGITVHTGTDITIANNSIRNVNTGITLRPANPAEDISVTGNIVRNTRSWGIRLRSSDNATVTGNIVHDVTGANAIHIEDTAGAFSLTANVIRDVSDGNAIAMESVSDAVVISSNLIRDIVDSTGAVRVESGDCIATGNYIDGATGNAFSVTGGTPTFSNNVCHIQSGSKIADINDSYVQFINNRFHGQNDEEDGIRRRSGTEQLELVGNRFDNISEPVSGTGIQQSDIVRHNSGLRSENKGAITISSGETSQTVSHGLDIEPSAEDILVTPQGSIGGATHWWIDSVDSSNFDINLDADPGQDVTIGWQLSIEA